MSQINEIHSMPLGNPALNQATQAGSRFNHVRGVIIKKYMSYIFNPISEDLKSFR